MTEPSSANAQAADSPPTPASFKARIQGLTGWRRCGLLFLLGALAALALPPIYLVFLLIPAFTGLMWLAEKTVTRKALFFTGWWFGAGHAAAGLYWIHESFLVDAARFAWLIPFALGGISLVMGLFPALALILIPRKNHSPLTPAAIIGFAAAWVLTEWVRSWFLTGFPWNLTGSVWAFSNAMLQPAAWIGTYGLSFITVLAAASFALINTNQKNLTLPILSVLVLGLFWIGGEARLSAGHPADVAGVQLRIVQPNIPQHLKWKQDLRLDHFKTLLKLSSAIARPGGDDKPFIPPTHIIWPETATPFFLGRTPGAQKAIGAITPEGGATITGSPRTVNDPDAPFQVWNSVHALNDKGQITHTFDKFHLVPFGEYVPYRSILGFLGKLTEGRTDFTPGPGPITWNLPGAPPVGPLICYEIIFPGHVADPDNRPAWLLNLTNDAWFGTSTGPHQHLVAARLRAVEEGLPVIRAANTGISAVIDSYGEVVEHLELQKQGIIDSPLPGFLEKTFYADFSKFLVAVSLLIYSLSLFIVIKN